MMNPRLNQKRTKICVVKTKTRSWKKLKWKKPMKSQSNTTLFQKSRNPLLNNPNIIQNLTQKLTLNDTQRNFLRVKLKKSPNTLRSNRFLSQTSLAKLKTKW